MKARVIPKKYYHATSLSNFQKIQDDEVIKTGMDGIVYLTTSAEDAYKFIGLRVWDEPIVILEIAGLERSNIIETFDHSYKFFKCRSYGYTENIPYSKVIHTTTYRARVDQVEDHSDAACIN